MNNMAQIKNQKAYEFYCLVREMRKHQIRADEMAYPNDIAQAQTLEKKVDAIIEATEAKINPQPTQQTMNL